MKINHPNTTNLSNLGSSGIGKSAETEALAKAKERQATAGSAASTDPDNVSLSNLSGSVRASLSDSPERAARLEQLSAQVAAGTYHVDSATLSKDIVNETLGDSGDK